MKEFRKANELKFVSTGDLTGMHSGRKFKTKWISIAIRNHIIFIVIEPVVLWLNNIVHQPVSPNSFSIGFANITVLKDEENV